MPRRTLARVQLAPSSPLIMTPWPIVPTRMVPLGAMLRLLTPTFASDYTILGTRATSTPGRRRAYGQPASHPFLPSPLRHGRQQGVDVRSDGRDRRPRSCPRPGRRGAAARGPAGHARRHERDPVQVHLAWEEARKTGVYVLDDHGRLLPVVKDVVRLCADRGVSLSLGHLSPQEMEAIVDEMTALGYRRVFIDHPFSEVFEHDVPTMKRWADAGVRFALTWDELSPLLGIDPQDMVAAIRAIGPEHFMLSSDAGIPVLPPTVEAYRLLAAMLRAYGMTQPEMRQLMTGTAKEMMK